MNMLFAWPEWVPEWFSAWGWIAAIAAVAVIIAVIIVICVGRRRAKRVQSADDAQAASDETPVEEAVEPEVMEDTDAESAEEVEEPAEEVEEPAEEVEERVEEVEERVEEPAEVSAEAERVDEKPIKAKSSAKTYHISKRKSDNRWQVKMAGGSRAIKLFFTQAEAIDFAKKLADSQEARIVIHKEDGSFRRLTYHKKK